MSELKNEGNETKESNGALKRAVIGGVVGASVGYISSAENRKKIMEATGKEVLKEKGEQLGDKAKETMLSLKESGQDKSSQALEKVKTTAANIFTKNNSDDEVENEEDLDEQEYEELKDENDQMRSRLDDLEDKVDKILDLTLNENDNSNSNDDKGKKSKNTTSKTKSKSRSKNSTKSSSAKKIGGTKKKNSSKKKSEEDTAVTSNDDTSSA